MKNIRIRRKKGRLTNRQTQIKKHADKERETDRQVDKRKTDGLVDRKTGFFTIYY